MAEFIIEREIPGAAGLSLEQLQQIAHKSVCALKHLPELTWKHSYIAGDRFFCIYDAPDEQGIVEHARRGGFPITRVTEIAAMLSPLDAPAEPANVTASA